MSRLPLVALKPDDLSQVYFEGVKFSLGRFLLGSGRIIEAGVSRSVTSLLSFLCARRKREAEFLSCAPVG